MLLHGIFRRAKKVWGLPTNPAAEVEKPPQGRGGDIQVFSPVEVWALARAAADAQDAAILLTAAFTGLRLGELLALQWRDIDFTGQTIRVRGSYSARHLTTPKSGKVRAVPLATDVATALATIGRRDLMTGDDDLVFIGPTGSHVDGSALRRRYKKVLAAAGLRPRARTRGHRQKIRARPIPCVPFRPHPSSPERRTFGDALRPAPQVRGVCSWWRPMTKCRSMNQAGL